MKQAGLSSCRYIEDTLVKNSAITVQLVSLFDARMNPEYGAFDEGERQANVHAIAEQIKKALNDVASLDEDRILRWYLDLPWR